MGKKSGSAGSKLRFTAYKSLDKRTTNAKLRLMRHLKKHPGDAQAEDALKNVGSRTFRTAPKTKGGWVTDTLRSAMLYIPYLTGKGTPIALKFPEQIPSLLHSHSQSIPLTRENVKGFAGALRYSKNAPFMKVPVIERKKVKGEEVLELVVKHTSKLSNFKGKSKK